MLRARALGLGAVVACAASVGLWAQSAAPQSPTPGAGGARTFVAIGCVGREAGIAGPGGPGNSVAPPRFFLTDTRGDKPAVYRLDGDQTELTFHVGHTLEIAGPLVTAKQAGLPTGGPNASALVMKIATLTYVSRTCVSIK